MLNGMPHLSAKNRSVGTLHIFAQMPLQLEPSRTRQRSTSRPPPAFSVLKIFVLSSFCPVVVVVSVLVLVNVISPTKNGSKYFANQEPKTD